MSVFTIRKSSASEWESLKKLVGQVAKDLEGERKATEIVNTLFFGDEVRSNQIASVFDRNHDGKIVIDEFDNPSGVCPFVVYDYDEEGRDKEYEYYCIRTPQNQFQSLAKFFTDHDDSILDYISDLDSFRYETHEPSGVDSNDLGSNAPMLLAGYEEFVKRVSK